MYCLWHFKPLCKDFKMRFLASIYRPCFYTPSPPIFQSPEEGTTFPGKICCLKFSNRGTKQQYSTNLIRFGWGKGQWMFKQWCVGLVGEKRVNGISSSFLNEKKSSFRRYVNHPIHQNMDRHMLFIFPAKWLAGHVGTMVGLPTRMALASIGLIHQSAMLAGVWIDAGHILFVISWSNGRISTLSTLMLVSLRVVSAIVMWENRASLPRLHAVNMSPMTNLLCTPEMCMQPLVHCVTKKIASIIEYSNVKRWATSGLSFAICFSG